MIGEEIKKEIVDKLQNYISTGKKVHITTMPSAKFPKGKFYNCFINLISSDEKEIIVIDDVDGRILIKLSLIISPEDIEDYKELKNK